MSGPETIRVNPPRELLTLITDQLGFLLAGSLIVESLRSPSGWRTRTRTSAVMGSDFTRSFCDAGEMSGPVRSSDAPNRGELTDLS